MHRQFGRLPVVVAGQMLHASAILQSADHQDRLLVAAQSAGTGAGAAAGAFGVQQRGYPQYRLLAYRQGGTSPASSLWRV